VAVMITVTIPGGTRELQQQMYDQVGDLIVEQEGFVFHSSGPVEGGWRLHEVWETRDQLDRWLNENIFPRMPDDAPRPEMDVEDLEFVIRPRRK